MIALYIGGVKSGKSRHAEAKALTLSPRPLYLATSEIIDDEMKERVDKHKNQRAENFELLEEPLKLADVLAQQEGVVLVECLSMWINNMLYYKKSQEEILAEVQSVLESSTSRVFVLNDVGSGIIPLDALSRLFVDLSGIIAQMIAAKADEVYHCIAGIATRIK